MSLWKLSLCWLGLGFSVGAIVLECRATLATTPTPTLDSLLIKKSVEETLPQPIVETGIEAIAESNQAPAIAQSPTAPTPANSAEQLNLDPDVVEESPVLQRWLEEIPDVRSQIRNDPAFRTRVRLGYTQLPSTEPNDGFYVGVEDGFVGRTGLTVSGEYQQTFEGDRSSYGGDLRYYIRPLGSTINIAPVAGYRHLETDDYTAEGVNVGLRAMLSLSRTGAADVAIAQTWVAPGTDEEVGLTTLSFGYAITRHLRISTDIQRQNAQHSKDSRFGVGLEWMF